MRELVPPTISVEAWAVRAHPLANQSSSLYRILALALANRVGWLASVDAARDLSKSMAWSSVFEET